MSSSVLSAGVRRLRSLVAGPDESDEQLLDAFTSRRDEAAFATLHCYFLERLAPVCRELFDAAVAAGDVRAEISVYELMRGVGNLCVGRDLDPNYDPRRLIAILLDGLRTPPSP